MQPITHHIIDKEQPLRQFLCDQFGWTPELFHFYLSFGCVYINKKRTLTEIHISVDDYLRIHHQPRRFNCKFDWSKKIHFENDEFLVINKPSGVPVHPTLDNFVENVIHQLQSLTSQKLYPCHRLDVNTNGLLLLAKSSESAAKLNQLFEAQKIHKTYQARCLGDLLPNQHYQAYMEVNERSPKKLFKEPTENSKVCQLKILHSHKASLPRKSPITDVSATDRSAIERTTTNQRDKDLHVTDYEIELITGRTHQIRAQLAFLGRPILGDQLYGCKYTCSGIISDHPLGQQNSQAIALTCTKLKWADFSFEIPANFSSDPSSL